MPRENKKVRTRRSKHQETLGVEPRGTKRKHEDEEHGLTDEMYFTVESNTAVDQGFSMRAANDLETPFFGLLTENEHDKITEASQFFKNNYLHGEGVIEEREAFISSLFDMELSQKEMKVACSQSHSRFIEEIIRVSNSDQLRHLFDCFSGNFLHLIQHRFASHCCETLFQRTYYLIANGDYQVDLEPCFLSMLDELEGNFAFLMTDRHGSHLLRTLLNILSKTAPEDELSKPRPEADKTANEVAYHPTSFIFAADKISKDVVAGLNTSSARSLSVHPSANPILQKIVQHEKSNDERRGIVAMLIPEEKVEAETEGLSFITGLVYDPVGSRLLEQIIKSCKAKLFKSIFKEAINPKLESISRNDIASYIAIASLGRLSGKDLGDLMPTFSNAISNEAKRPLPSVIRRYVERCTIREVDMEPLQAALLDAYGNDPSRFLFRFLGVNGSMLADKEVRLPLQVTHACLLAQTMIDAPSCLSCLIYASLEHLSGDELATCALNPISSRLLQKAMTAKTSELSFRRKMVSKLLGHIVEIATDFHGAHMFESLWESTSPPLFSYRERVAQELLAAQSKLRASGPGEKVWRKWNMDIFKRSKPSWSSNSKADVTHDKGIPHLTPIERARQRYAQSKVTKAH